MVRGKTIFGTLLLSLALLVASAGCSSRPLSVLNTEDGTSRLSAEANGVRVTGGGSASGRGWDRRVLISFRISNDRKTALTLARKDVVLVLGLRRVSAHTIIGSKDAGPVESMKIRPGTEVAVIAQFSSAFAIRKSGHITLRFDESKTDNELKLEIPIKLRHVPKG